MNLEKPEPCSDTGCVVAKRTGMGTNGGCRCLDGLPPRRPRVRIRNAFAWYRQEVDRLLGELEQANAPSACDEGFDTIAALCGCPTWEYAGQVIRDVKAVVEERDELKAKLAAKGTK